MGRKAWTKDHVWKFIKQAGEDECWEWQHTKKHGYGALPVKGKQLRATRVVYELTHGIVLDPIYRFSSDSKIVMHSCDNPGCCNPKHLYLASPKENTQDMIRKGRRFDNRGERNWQAKLTNIQADEIRKLCKQKIPQKDIANQYGVSVPTVSGIKWNRIYRID